MKGAYPSWKLGRKSTESLENGQISTLGNGKSERSRTVKNVLGFDGEERRAFYGGWGYLIGLQKDYLVFGHALPELLERFSIGTIYVSPVMFDHPNASLRYLSAAIQRAKVPMGVISSGNRLSGGPGCWLQILHPPPHGLPSTSNANSIVVSLEYCGRRVILPADLQSPGLDDVLAEPPLHCDMLLVPHHGSKTGMPAELSAWSTPDWAVFSADHRYDTSTVEAIYARRGHVLHTADSGAVMARVDEKGLKVETFVGTK